MTRGRLLTVLVIAWLVALGVMFRPRTHPIVPIRHARLLDRPARNLPTLAPQP
jgi:hypothetical protein